jgi:hypothetical protein
MRPLISKITILSWGCGSLLLDTSKKADMEFLRNDKPQIARRNTSRPGMGVEIFYILVKLSGSLRSRNVCY